VTDKYEFIDAGYATVATDTAAAPTVMRMCEWLQISKSGFYEWRSRPESATAKRREMLKTKIRALFKANDSTYGYRRMHAALARGGEQAVCCAKTRSWRLTWRFAFTRPLCGTR